MPGGPAIIRFKYPFVLISSTMAETTTIKKIYDEIKVLKKDVTFIKKHMFDRDTIMTTEEKKRFEESSKCTH